ANGGFATFFVRLGGDLTPRPLVYVSQITGEKVGFLDGVINEPYITITGEARPHFSHWTATTGDGFFSQGSAAAHQITFDSSTDFAIGFTVPHKQPTFLQISAAADLYQDGGATLPTEGAALAAVDPTFEVAPGQPPVTIVMHSQAD